MRTAASEIDSGLDRAERSASSAQGRRWERPFATVSEMRLMNARKAGVAIGGCWDSREEGAAAEGMEIGRVGGAVEAIVVAEFGRSERVLKKGEMRQRKRDK